MLERLIGQHHNVSMFQLINEKLYIAISMPLNLALLTHQASF